MLKRSKVLLTKTIDGTCKRGLNSWTDILSFYSQDVSVNEGDRRSEVPVISEIHKTLCNICISCQSMQNVLKYEIHTTKSLLRPIDVHDFLKAWTWKRRY